MISYLCHSSLLLLAVGAKSKTKKSSDPFAKKELLLEFVRRDENHLAEPYLGGFNSQQAAMLQVEFFPFAQIRSDINPRWRAEREMVEDMQKMLLTGGVKTNIFRKKDVAGQSKSTFVFVLND